MGIDGICFKTKFARVKKMISKAEQNGRDDFKLAQQGSDSAKVNPYIENTEAHQLWEKGYTDALKEFLVDNHA